MNKQKLDKLSSLYVVVAVLITAMSLFSFTFAWYIKSSTQYLDIKFANPIIVDIHNDVSVVTPIGGDIKAMMPGSSFNVKLLISMPQNSSNAYVRAKMSVEFDNVYDEKNQLVNWVNGRYIELFNVDDSISSEWVKVDFSNNEIPDIWWVCGSANASREVKPGDMIEFLNGVVKLSLDIDNKFAEKNITIVFVVESLQTAHLPGGVDSISDPLGAGVANAKKHEVWGSYPEIK